MFIGSSLESEVQVFNGHLDFIRQWVFMRRYKLSCKWFSYRHFKYWAYMYIYSILNCFKLVPLAFDMGFQHTKVWLLYILYPRINFINDLDSTWEYDVKVVDILNAIFIYCARFEDVGSRWGRWFLASWISIMTFSRCQRTI